MTFHKSTRSTDTLLSSSIQLEPRHQRNTKVIEMYDIKLLIESHVQVAAFEKYIKENAATSLKKAKPAKAETVKEDL